MKKKKVLIIVAHPDDETIWMGGTILRKIEDWDTTIISLCRKSDEDRAPKFKKVCDVYNAKSFISDLDDESSEPLDISEFISRILDFAEKQYDEIYTHGKNGEYGHIRHIECNEAVKKIIDDKTIKTDKLFFFSYKKKSSPGTDTGFDSYAQVSANKFINLNNLELIKKKDLIQNVYGFSKNGFEERTCREQESFDEYLK